MSKDLYIRKLRRQLFVAKAASLGMALWGVFWLWMTWTHFRGDKIFLAAGGLFLVVGLLGVIIAGRWAQRAIQVYQQMEPVSMRLRLVIQSWSDNTDYIAYLSYPQGTEPGREFKVPVKSPSWQASLIEGREVPALVYLDPDTRKVAVIETEHGLLWNWSSEGRVE